MGLIERLTRGKGKKAKGCTPLEDAASAIIDLEKRLEDEKAALWSSKKRLQNAMGDAIVEGKAAQPDERLTAEIITKQAEIDAITDLIKTATEEAVELAREAKQGVAVLRDQQEAEMAKLLAAKERAMFAELAAICKRFELKVEAPTKGMAGKVIIPATSLDEEAASILQSATCPLDVTVTALAGLGADMGKTLNIVANDPHRIVESLLHAKRAA